MSNNAKNSNVTAESVAAQAAEDKLVTPTVPAQSQPAPDQEVVVEDTETPHLVLVDGGKKTLKERMAFVAKKLKENKKVVSGVAVAVVLAAVAFSKFAVAFSAEQTEENEENEENEMSPEDEAALPEIKGAGETLSENA